MTQYYYVDSITGQLVGQTGETPQDPIPEGQTEVTVSPPDERMYWNFMGAWYWTVGGLTAVSKQKLSSLLFADIEYNAVNYPISMFSINDWEALSARARLEEAEGVRSLTFNNGEVVEFDNAELIGFMDTFYDRYQLLNDVYSIVLDAIIEEEVTDIVSLDAAWSSEVSGYVSTRVALPTQEEIVEAVADLQTLYSSLSGSVSSLSSSVSSLSSSVSSLSSGLSGKVDKVTGKGLSANDFTSTLKTKLDGIEDGAQVRKAVAGTTVKSGAFPIFKSATVASGVAVFHLTDDGFSTGNPLFATEVFADSVGLIVNDAAASYQMSWAFTNSNKTLTVTANKLSTANILTGVLGQAQANGAVVKLSVWGR